MLCIVGGVQWKASLPNSLVLGVKPPGNKKLICFGKASIGLKQSDFALIKEFRRELEQEECPFETEKAVRSDSSGETLTWLHPSLTCWVSFQELTNDGHFRHPR